MWFLGSFQSSSVTDFGKACKNIDGQLISQQGLALHAFNSTTAQQQSAALKALDMWLTNPGKLWISDLQSETES